MKKFACLLLAVLMFLTSAVSLAEGGWTCPDCQSTKTGKFCGNCGRPKPEEPAAPQLIDFTQAAAYALSPITDETIVSCSEISENIYSITLSSGAVWTGMLNDTDGVYSIQIMDQSTADYTQMEAPYDYEDTMFISILNYLIQSTGHTITTITPLIGTIYTATDDAGTAYTLTVMGAPSIAMICLIIQ